MIRGADARRRRCRAGDCAVEIAEIEGAFEPGRTRSVEDVAEKLAELVPLIASDVEVGMHFCCGDSGGVHFVQPRDLAVIVALANGLGRHVDRSLSWIHMPVPLDRRDDAYFAPLADLDTDVADVMFLGLLHVRPEPKFLPPLLRGRRVALAGEPPPGPRVGPPVRRWPRGPGRRR